MRTFYLDGNKIQTSYNCPAGFADCAAFEYLRNMPDLSVNYKMQTPINTDIIIGPVLNPLKAGTITMEIKRICNMCPNYLVTHQREHMLRYQKQR